jgi:sugar transferase (PEP-CTERM/EpsH1 system associated)
MGAHAAGAGARRAGVPGTVAMPMRIMHVVNDLRKGGLENGLVNLIERMDSTRFEHVVCTVRGLGPHAEHLQRRRVRVMSIETSASRSRFQTPALVNAIRNTRPHLVHSRNWGAIEAVLAARLTRAPSVVHSEHGYDAQTGVGESRRRRYLRRAAFTLADRVITVSSQLRAVHAERTGFPARKITVIHNGVDCARFAPDASIRDEVRQELDIPLTAFCIGCVANLLPVKDHMTLLGSLRMLDQRGTDWRLLLVGEGPERPALEAFVQSQSGWRERVAFLGSSSRVPSLLRAMDTFVLASTAEGICNSLLEAMATGLPVVATAVGGNPEVIIDGESGLLFRSGDVETLGHHLTQLSAEPLLRAQFGEQALLRVRREFSIDSMVRAYEALYDSVGAAKHAAVYQ